MLNVCTVSVVAAVHGSVVVVFVGVIGVVVVIVELVVELDVILEVDVVFEMLVVSTRCDFMLVLFERSVDPVVVVFSVVIFAVCLIVEVKVVGFESIMTSDVVMVVSSVK